LDGVIYYFQRTIYFPMAKIPLSRAYHEAGHAVVAWALGLAVSRIEIGIGGDNAKGATNVEHDQERPLIDRLALCAAGLEAQKLFGAPTHDLAGWGDYGKIFELLDGFDEEASSALTDDGHKRAYDLLRANMDRVQRIANALMVHGKLDHDAATELLA